MTENERVKELRKARELTLEKFGERVGVTRGAMSAIENGHRGVTDQMRRSICREFGVREEWLRDGEGEMEDSSDTFDLDELMTSVGATDLERELVRAYFELDELTRKKVMDTLRQTILHSAPAEPVAPSAMTREQYHAELDRQLDDEEKVDGASSDSGQGGSGSKMA